MTNLLVSGQVAKSESVKPFTCNYMLVENKIPLPGSFFKYCRTLFTTSKCGFLGLAMYWLNLWTTNAMSCLVMVKYSSLPISLLQALGSLSSSPSYLLNFTFCSIGVLVGLHPNKPASFNTSKVYFLWQSDILLFDLAISKPRKYLKSPKSFNLNFWSNNTLNCPPPFCHYMLQKNHPHRSIKPWNNDPFV